MRIEIRWPDAGRRAAPFGLLLASLVPASLWGVQASDVPPVPPSSVAAAPTPVTKPHPRDRTLLKREWGVEPMGVKITAAGHMLEFRYRVLDETKAKPLFARLTKPYLVHERTGRALAVPRPATTGPLRNSDPPIRDRIYWMFFTNAGRLVKPGEKVAVVIGDFRADGLVVE